MEGRLPGSPLVQSQSMALEYIQPLSYIFVVNLYLFGISKPKLLFFCKPLRPFLQATSLIMPLVSQLPKKHGRYCTVFSCLKGIIEKNSYTNITKVWADVTAPHRGEIVRQVRFGTVILGGFHLKIGRRRVETEAGTPWQACQPGDGEDCSRGYWRGARVCGHL